MEYRNVHLGYEIYTAPKRFELAEEPRIPQVAVCEPQVAIWESKWRATLPYPGSLVGLMPARHASPTVGARYLSLVARIR